MSEQSESKIKEITNSLDQIKPPVIRSEGMPKTGSLDEIQPPKKK